MTGPIDRGGRGPDRRPARGYEQATAAERHAEIRPSDRTAAAAVNDQALDRLRGQLETPSVIADRYEMRGLLGRGGMGEVHRAFDRQLGREVAVKVLPADASAHQLAARLEQEARVLARLEHPGIVPVYDAGVLEDGRVYYVMRYVEGMRLDEYVHTGVSRGELLRGLLRIAEAIGYAHERGVIHRDLKPGNVMIGPYGDRLVLDWGVAKVVDGTGRNATEGGGEVILGGRASPAGPGDGRSAIGGLTADGAVVGTPGYMAPEQAAGLPVDARADVYALGVMMREMLAAHPEPSGNPFAAIVAMATATQPAQRYPTVAAFAEDLRRGLDGEAVSAHREAWWEKLARFVKRHQVAILLLLAYAIVRAFIFLTRGI